MVIQRILRLANANTTATYYIKTAADDVRSAMAKLENVVPNAPRVPETPVIPAVPSARDTFRTLTLDSTVPSTVN